MTARDVILREMGLTPVWRLRSPASAAAGAAASAAGAAGAAGAADALDTVDAIKIGTAHTASTAGPRTPDIDNAVTRRHHTTGASPQAPVYSAEDRSNAIAQMSWSALRESIAQCTACALCKTRTHTVPGVGDLSPSWMIIGDAPDESDDKQGEPFAGEAGRLLDAMLFAIGKKRSDGVFLANLIKCRPPSKRSPEAAEIAACAPYLTRQIELARPRLLVAAGECAAQTLLNGKDRLDSLRSRGGGGGDGSDGSDGSFNNVPVVVTYHPSELLTKTANKAKAWEDLIKARSLAP